MNSSSPSDRASLPVQTIVPTMADIRAAAARLAPVAVRTPLLEVPALSRRVGGRLLIKAEALQRTGSFKFRGAFNRISLIPAADRPKGVVAFSSGNHAQGVACAAAMLGAPATIVMPSDAPAIKIENTKGYGAKVITYDRLKENREAIGAKLAAETGATLVKPFDDPGLIAGQGTVGLEIAEQCLALGLTPDQVIVPASGGGLLAGVATAVQSIYPNARAIVAEPAGYEDHARSLEAGRRVAINPGASTLCDALMSPEPGEITWAINSRAITGAVAAADPEVAEAMRQAFLHLKLVVEPGGAVGLAAALLGKLPTEGKVTVVVCSGGNVDPELFARILGRAI
ncbi:threonine/serine dehydratase [Desertibaculum subflavum]|uniref:threonine/serine dehydratase n=1 Tax=Desertibaculum subflavum TaxID=2268458 RepID=UPI0034D27DE4